MYIKSKGLFIDKYVSKNRSTAQVYWQTKEKSETHKLKTMMVSENRLV